MAQMPNHRYDEQIIADQGCQLIFKRYYKLSYMNFGHKDLKDAEVQSYFTTMKKSNTYQNRLETANILGKMYEKNYEYSDGIFTRIYRFISDSNDKQEKKIGLIVLAVLGLKMQGSARSAFVNKFHSPVFKLFENNNDQNLIPLVKEAYSVILEIGGNQNDLVVDSDLTNSIQLLKVNAKDVKKMSAYAAIQVLVNTSPYLSFKKLSQKHQEEYQDNLSILINAAKNKNIKVRNSYLEFLSDYVEYASEKKDHSFQEHTMMRLLQFNPQQYSQELIHLHIETMKILLKHMKTIFLPSKLKECVNFILEKIQTNKSLTIQTTLIQTVPYMINTESPLKILAQIMSYLRSINDKDQVSAQKGINQILSIFQKSIINLSEEILKPLLSDIIQSLTYYSSKPLTKSAKQRNNTLYQLQLLIQSKVQTLSLILINECRNKHSSSSRITTLHNRHKKTSRANQKMIIEKPLAEVLLNAEQLNNLASLAMLLALNKKTLKFVNEISKRNIYNLSALLERKLLIILSKILTGNSPKTLTSNKEVNQQFRLFQQKVDTILIIDSQDNKVKAIQALSLFKFQENMRDYVGGFIKEKVLKKYLEWGNNGLMRCAAVEAAFNLYTKKNNAIAENQMMEILDRLIRVGMTDPEQTVREKVFSQLYLNIDKIDNFYNFILHESILIHLFQATEDPNQQIRLTSLKCVTCLYKKQPSPTIIPFLKKHLYNILGSLKTNFKYHPQKKYLIKSLLMFIEQSPNIIENHVDLLLESILGYLEDSKSYEGMEVLFFKAFKVIIQNHPHKTILYIGDICKHIVKALGDRLGRNKRSQSLKLLNSIVKSCGYVVIPYFQVPELMDSLLYLLKSQISIESRMNILRIIGGFGAIDQKKYHRIRTLLLQYNQNKDNEILAHEGFCFNFLKWRKVVMNNRSADQYSKQLTKYSDEMILLEANKSRMILHENNPPKLDNDNLIQYLISRYQNTSLIKVNDSSKNRKKTQENKNYKYLFNKAYLSNFNMYIIQSLMNIINDPFLKEKMQLALDVLVQVFEILGQELEKDLESLLEILIQCQEKQSLNLLIYLARDCNISMHVDEIISFIFKQSTSIETLTDILEIITYKFHKHLRNSVPAIMSKLHSILDHENTNPKFHIKVLVIYRNLKELLEPHLAELIPTILEKFFGNKSTEATNTSIDLFMSLTDNCISMVQYLSQIVSKLTNILRLCANNHSSCKPCLRNKIGDCFVLFLINYQQQFMIYLPLIHQGMLVVSDKHELYEKSLHFMENCYYGNLRDQFSQEQIARIISEPRIPLLNRYEIPKFVKKIEGTEELIHEFDIASKKFIEEDWIQWLRKISVLMIKKSPNIVLRTCSDLAQGYSELALQLFNIAFYCLWEILFDSQKKILIDHIKSIVTLQPQPSQIFIKKAILNLCDFMNRKKNPLEIPISVLSQCASNSSVFTQALYYKEIQFETSPEMCIESLIEIYMKLGQSQNANGLLTIANNSRIECKAQWYEKLNKYKEAYGRYKQELSNYDQNDEKFHELFLKKLLCLSNINEEKFIDQLQENEKLLKNIKINKEELAIAACTCYSDLQQWDQVEEWSKDISNTKNPQQKGYFEALLCIYNDDRDNALIQIDNSRKLLYNQISELIAFSSSTTSFSKILKAQKLCELEEIVNMMKMEQKVQNQKGTQISVNSRNYPTFTEEVGKINLQSQYSKRLEQLKRMWSDRLLGCPKQQKIWKKFVTIRSLFFSKLQYFSFFYEYCEILLKNYKVNSCEKMLHEFKQQMELFNKQEELYKVIPENAKSDFNDIQLQKKSQLIELLQIKISMAEGLVMNEEKVDYIINFLDSKDLIDSSKKSQLYQQCVLRLLYSDSQNSRGQTQLNPEHIHKSIEILNKSLLIYNSQAQLKVLGRIYLEFLDNYKDPVANIKLALKSYMRILKIKQTDHQYFLQSCLKVFSILLQYSNSYNQIYEQFINTYKEIPVSVWTNVIPQMIAHLHQQPHNEMNSNNDNNFIKIIKQLFLVMGMMYPETILYSLNFAIRSKVSTRVSPALEILDKIKRSHNHLCQEIQIISKELSNAAVKLKQYFYDSIESIWGLYSQNKSSKEIITLLNNLKQEVYGRKKTNSEVAFHQQYGQQIRQGYYWLQQYQMSNNMLCLSQAFEIFIQIYIKIKESFDNLKKIYLTNVAPKLTTSRAYLSSIPGMYRMKGENVRVSHFQNELVVLQSKQRPRKLKIFGTDGKQYNFLLKGREDIRLDERVMQFFGLVNKLLEKQRETLIHDLKIQRYSIIPLTVNAGLIGWVENCDTLNELIKDYRTTNKIRLLIQRQIYEKITPHYAYLPLMNKLEIFEAAQQLTQGKDLKNIFYYNSTSTEEWVERRNSYTKSLATMSIVGYILGLGDRHPSNIMINKHTGKVVHIDFGDCFQVAALRQKFPQKVPFRLTRMLRNVMGPVGIHGVYKETCKNVMSLLRNNKESLLSVLQTFVHDPILSWKIITERKDNTDQQNIQGNKNIQYEPQKQVIENKEPENIIGSIMQGLGEAINYQKKQKNQNKIPNQLSPDRIKNRQSIYPEKINEKAINALERIQKKLEGTDFKEQKMDTNQQVERLICQAISHENICQSWPGWCPYW